MSSSSSGREERDRPGASPEAPDPGAGSCSCCPRFHRGKQTFWHPSGISPGSRRTAKGRRLADLARRLSGLFLSVIPRSIPSPGGRSRAVAGAAFRTRRRDAAGSRTAVVPGVERISAWGPACRSGARLAAFQRLVYQVTVFLVSGNLEICSMAGDREILW